MRYKITDAVVNQAEKILCSNEKTIEEQLKIIIEHLDLDDDDYDTLDCIEGVEVSEQFENFFTVSQFIEQLPFDKFVPGQEIKPVGNYVIEYDGEYFQSVFPSAESEKSQLHDTWVDAFNYLTEECGINNKDITSNVIFTVQDLINELLKVENKQKPVFTYSNGNLFNIINIDHDIIDRVDININN